MTYEIIFKVNPKDITGVLKALAGCAQETLNESGAMLAYSNILIPGSAGAVYAEAVVSQDGNTVFAIGPTEDRRMTQMNCRSFELAAVLLAKAVYGI